MLEVVFDPNGNPETISKSYIELVTTLTRNEPIVYNIEPSGLPIRIDKQVKITFATNKYCDRYELINKSFGKISGVSDRVAYIGANIFDEGENEITLISYYNPMNHVKPWYKPVNDRVVTKTVKFIGKGTFSSTRAHSMTTVNLDISSAEIPVLMNA